MPKTIKKGHSSTLKCVECPLKCVIETVELTGNRYRHRLSIVPRSIFNAFDYTALV